jgi:hypothetical protein
MSRAWRVTTADRRDRLGAEVHRVEPAHPRQPLVYGDFSFAEQPTWLRAFSVVLMFAGMTTTAVLVAFIADLLLSRRFVQTTGRRRVRHLRNHLIVVGLGSVGIRVVSELTVAGYDVAIIEQDDENHWKRPASTMQERWRC